MPWYDKDYHISNGHGKYFMVKPLNDNPVNDKNGCFSWDEIADWLVSFFGKAEGYNVRAYATICKGINNLPVGESTNISIIPIHLFVNVKRVQ